MLRGINQQQIFEDREDFEKFLQILKDCKAVTQRTVPCVQRDELRQLRDRPLWLR